MKMIIGTDLPAGYTVSHEDLAQSAGTLIAHALLPLFAENMSDEAAKANVAGIVTELAYLFDEGEIALGGRIYRPRIAFVDDTNTVLPGAQNLDTLHALVDDPFDIPAEAKISFQEPEFEEG